MKLFSRKVYYWVRQYVTYRDQFLGEDVFQYTELKSKGYTHKCNAKWVTIDIF